MGGNAATQTCSPDHAGRSGEHRKTHGWAAGGTLIRRYARAPTPAGPATRPRSTATAIPPLRGDADVHGGEATRAATITDSTGTVVDRGRAPVTVRSRLGPLRRGRAHSRRRVPGSGGPDARIVARRRCPTVVPGRPDALSAGPWPRLRSDAGAETLRARVGSVLHRGPVVVDEGVKDRVAPGPVGAAAMLAEYAFPDRADAFDGGPGPFMTDVRDRRDAHRDEDLEREGQHHQFRLDIHAAARHHCPSSRARTSAGGRPAICAAQRPGIRAQPPRDEVHHVVVQLSPAAREPAVERQRQRRAERGVTVLRREQVLLGTDQRPMLNQVPRIHHRTSHSRRSFRRPPHPRQPSHPDHLFGPGCRGSDRHPVPPRLAGITARWSAGAGGAGSRGGRCPSRTRRRGRRPARHRCAAARRAARG